LNRDQEPLVTAHTPDLNHFREMKTDSDYLKSAIFNDSNIREGFFIASCCPAQIPLYFMKDLVKRGLPIDLNFTARSGVIRSFL
jgi:hypothetical protein